MSKYLYNVDFSDRSLTSVRGDFVAGKLHQRNKTSDEIVFRVSQTSKSKGSETFKLFQKQLGQHVRRFWTSRSLLENRLEICMVWYHWISADDTVAEEEEKKVEDVLETRTCFRYISHWRWHSPKTYAISEKKLNFFLFLSTWPECFLFKTRCAQKTKHSKPIPAVYVEHFNDLWPCLLVYYPI